MGDPSTMKASIVESEQIEGLLDIAGVAGVRDILDAFWRSTDDLSAELGRNVASGDVAAAARAAHALKGSAANVGAHGLAEVARAIETQMKSGDVAAAAAALGRLSAIYVETRAALESLVDARG